jgi:ribulose-5-phosphate 4-epimerase/fuculose-1-phosphate aldolase
LEGHLNAALVHADGVTATLQWWTGRAMTTAAQMPSSAGNISVFMAWNPEVRRRSPLAEEIVLPLAAPALAGKTLLVTGSGRRLRDIQRDPEANMGAVLVHADGITATLHTSPRRLFRNLTSEFNSHLAVHQDQVASLRKHMIVLWSKHGVMARSDVSVTNAVDKIEYAETGAKYEYINLAIGRLGEGLRQEELVAVKDAFEVQTELI